MTSGSDRAMDKRREPVLRKEMLLLSGRRAGQGAQAFGFVQSTPKAAVQ